MVVCNQLEEVIARTVIEIRRVSRGFERVYVMFSGGRDSLVALHLTVTALGLDRVEALFIDTGIATPGLSEYVRDVCSSMNVKLNVVKSTYDYFELVLRKGFPTITRRWCKEFLKLRPLKEWISTVYRERTLLVTGVRADESWMKSKAEKLYNHPLLGIPVYAPIFEWISEQVKAYIKLYGLKENPLYEQYGKAYDCWCSVYKSPADFAILALNNPSFFARFVEAEEKLRSKGSGLYYNREKIYFKDIMRNPEKYLSAYPRKYQCPLCKLLVSGAPT